MGRVLPKSDIFRSSHCSGHADTELRGKKKVHRPKVVVTLGETQLNKVPESAVKRLPPNSQVSLLNKVHMNFVFAVECQQFFSCVDKNKSGEP